MEKRRIQIVYYSQSGSLKYLIEESMRPYLGDYVLIWNPIHCVKPFPFPWNRKRFFSVFCDSVLQRGCRIVNNEIKIEKDDMILLGFQPWFLHLSLPIQSFINSTQFGRIVKDREVILFTCYRNTGAMARRQMAAHVESRGGHIVAELEISDQSKERSSAFRFVRWFFTGKNNPFRNMEKQLKKGFEMKGYPVADEQWFLNLPYVGNVGSASIYLMLDELFHSGKLKQGHRVLLIVPESSRFSYSVALLTAV